VIIKDPRVRTCSGEDAELLIPPHPDLRVYPGWLRDRSLERAPQQKEAGPNSDSDAVSKLIDEMDAGDWLDHWGTAIYGGREFLVSEPYHMNRERIDQLLRFCDALNLAVNIQSSGHHYPTLTMRIFVWPKEWPAGDYFLQEDEGYSDQAQSSSAQMQADSSRLACRAHSEDHLSEADFEIAVCGLLQTKRMFAFVPQGEDHLDDVTFVAADHRESFVRENPSWRDVSEAYVKRRHQ
jgi:hypothetical protein